MFCASVGLRARIFVDLSLSSAETCASPCQSSCGVRLLCPSPLTCFVALCRSLCVSVPVSVSVNFSVCQRLCLCRCLGLLRQCALSNRLSLCFPHTCVIALCPLTLLSLAVCTTPSRSSRTFGTWRWVADPSPVSTNQYESVGWSGNRSPRVHPTMLVVPPLPLVLRSA